MNYDSGAAVVSTFAAPTVSPPGANNWSCQPTAQHPYPVVLVHGTLANMNDSWQAASPILANHGYCVFALNYGGASAASDFQGTGDIAASARQLASFVNEVLAATGAPKVDIVGQSQGGTMPRYYISLLGGAAKVDKLIGLAPSNYGTTLDGLTVLGHTFGLLAPVNSVLSTTCVACVEQEAGSAFLTALNAQPAAPNVTDITVQKQCPLDESDHLEIASDPVAMADMLNALDPAQPVRAPCQLVLPVFGPVGPVPSF